MLISSFQYRIFQQLPSHLFQAAEGRSETGLSKGPRFLSAGAGGWSQARPDAVVDQVPLSDGGPGFVTVLHVALGGRLVPVTAHGPLGDGVAGRQGIAI